MATRKTKKLTSSNGALVSSENYIIFDSSMRKIFVEGVLQDIKGMFEQKSDGKVSISYEDHDIKTHEFGFKLIVEKSKLCTKQMWSEVTSSIVNVVNYMFPANSLDNNIYSIDIEIFNDSTTLEVILISNW